MWSPGKRLHVHSSGFIFQERESLIKSVQTPHESLEATCNELFSILILTSFELLTDEFILFI